MRVAAIEAVQSPYQELSREVSAMLSDSISQRAYTTGTSDVLSSLMVTVATTLITDMKSLEPDFASVIEKEFWNLL